MNINNEQIRELLALYLAHDDMGIYPKAFSGGDNSYTQRTERMEGWNECCMKLTEKWGDYTTIVNSYPDEVVEMLINEELSLINKKLYVLCNDLFYWATADAEEITLEEIPELQACLKTSEKHGGLLWACRKRGMRPQQPYYKHFTDDERKLFDAAGPVRDRKDEG